MTVREMIEALQALPDDQKDWPVCTGSEMGPGVEDRVEVYPNGWGSLCGGFAGPFVCIGTPEH